MSARMIIDCGTTNLRVTIVDDAGRIAAQGKRPGGVRHTAIDEHNGRLKAMLADCIAQVLAEAGLSPEGISRCIAYGMITSNVGLMEIPHLEAPASADDLSAGVRTALFPDVAPFPISFIPGVRNFSGQVTMENFQGMDMMRGEETEAIGLFGLLGMQRECVLILPGSHNKFVRMDAQGRILGCMTSISGELLDAPHTTPFSRMRWAGRLRRSRTMTPNWPARARANARPAAWDGRPSPAAFSASWAGWRAFACAAICLAPCWRRMSRRCSGLPRMRRTCSS